MKKPVFKTSKRSYVNLPGDTPEHTFHVGQNELGGESLVNSADPAASPRDGTEGTTEPKHDYLGVTSTHLKVEGMTEEDPAFQKTGRLSNAAETFS